jgi:hypothetical protein
MRKQGESKGIRAISEAFVGQSMIHDIDKLVMSGLRRKEIYLHGCDEPRYVYRIGTCIKVDRVNEAAEGF